MNIFGIGNDTVEPERIAEKCNRPGFVNRVFSDNEINYCESMITLLNISDELFATSKIVWSTMNH